MRHALAMSGKRGDRWIGVLLALSFVLLIVGLFLPTMSVQTFIFFYRRLSIAGGLMALWLAHDYGLFAILTLFSVVFPLTKLGFGAALWLLADPGSPRVARILHWIEMLGKWSMLDVFVVALIVAAANISLMSDVAVHAGLYVFTASILLSIYALDRLGRAARRTRD